MRLSFDEYGMLLALCAKSRSEDDFTKVGGAAFDINHRVLAVAYNGLKPGAAKPDWMKLEENRSKKFNLMIHCESNLCARLTINECDTLYLTINPCAMCCQNIIALNIKRVVYLKEYPKCMEFKEIFNFHGIKYEQLSKESKNNIFNYLSDLSNFKELYL